MASFDIIPGLVAGVVESLTSLRRDPQLLGDLDQGDTILAEGFRLDFGGDARLDQYHENLDGGLMRWSHDLTIHVSHTVNPARPSDAALKALAVDEVLVVGVPIHADFKLPGLDIVPVSIERSKTEEYLYSSILFNIEHDLSWGD